jgi:hypothetical protein
MADVKDITQEDFDSARDVLDFLNIIEELANTINDDNTEITALKTKITELKTPLDEILNKGLENTNQNDKMKTVLRDYLPNTSNINTLPTITDVSTDKLQKIKSDVELFNEGIKLESEKFKQSLNIIKAKVVNDEDSDDDEKYNTVPPPLPVPVPVPTTVAKGTFDVNVFYSAPEETINTAEKNKNISIVFTQPASEPTAKSPELIVKKSTDVLTISMPFTATNAISYKYMSVFFQFLRTNSVSVDDKGDLTITDSDNNIKTMELLQSFIFDDSSEIYNKSTDYNKYKTAITASLEKIKTSSTKKSLLANVIINHIKKVIVAISTLESAYLKKWPNLVSLLGIQISKSTPKNEREAVGKLFELRQRLFTSVDTISNSILDQAPEIAIASVSSMTEFVNAEVAIIQPKSGGNKTTKRKSKLKRRKSERRIKSV